MTKSGDVVKKINTMKKFSIFRQHDSMQCGIACLQMVCKYFGREYSLDSLSKLCFATTEGVSLLGINEAANTLGLHTTCARATTMVLGEVPLPCILHWNQNHFVVLYKVNKGKKFYVADPRKGLVTYSLEEFKQHWISLPCNTLSDSSTHLWSNWWTSSILCKMWRLAWSASTRFTRWMMRTERKAC